MWTSSSAHNRQVTTRRRRCRVEGANRKSRRPISALKRSTFWWLRCGLSLVAIGALAATAAAQDLELPSFPIPVFQQPIPMSLDVTFQPAAALFDGEKRIERHCVSLEEAPDAYKSSSEVVRVVHEAGLSLRVARLEPKGVIKG